MHVREAAAVYNQSATAAKEHLMNAVRKMERQTRGRGVDHRPPVDYSDEVTEEQVKRLDDLVKKEFDSGEWVTVEGHP